MAAWSDLLAKLTSIDAVDDPRGRRLRLLRLVTVAELPFVFLVAIAPAVGLTALIGVPIVIAFVWWLMSQAGETQQERAAALATELTNAELVRTKEQVEQRQAASSLLTNLARRNQSLLNRQLAKIDQLEAQEQDSEALAQLFTLDHLATRMRRNAESLLVLSGEEPPRRWGQPVALGDIARGAIAEIEDYTRIDVAPGLDVMIAGRAVGDLVHLVAELIENAATFSPPTTRVLLGGAPTPDGGFIVTITDAGIAMSDDELLAANRTLAEAPQVGLQLSGMLGFHVVARLAARYGIRVWLTRGAGGGLVAMVALPADIVGAEAAAAPAPPAVSADGSVDVFSVGPLQVPVAPVPLTSAAAATLTGVSEVAAVPMSAPLPLPSAVPVDVPPYPMPVAAEPVAYAEPVHSEPAPVAYAEPVHSEPAPVAYAEPVHSEPAPVAYPEPGYDPLTAEVAPAIDAPSSPLGDELAHATLAPVPDLEQPIFTFHESSMFEQSPVADEAAAAAYAASADDEPYRFPVVDLPPFAEAPAVIEPPAEAPVIDVPSPAPVGHDAPAVAVPPLAPIVHDVMVAPVVEEAPVADVYPIAASVEVPTQSAAPEISATTPGGLARRVPRANLSPHLTQENASPVEDVVPPQAEEGAPERTGSLLSAFQSGIAAGRLGAGDDISGGE